MKAYAHKYDKETFEYLHTFPLQKNPKREGEYLIAVNATRVALPPFKQNERPVFNKPKDQWSIVPDFRDREYWLPDGSFHKIEKLGEAIPAEALDEPPPPTPEELEQQQHEQWKAERQAKVDAIIVEIDGMKFDGDETSQGRMARAAGLAETPDEKIRWILADNTVEYVTADQLKQAARAAGLEQEKLWIPDNTPP